MGFEINRSCSPAQAKQMRKILLQQGAVEVKSKEEAQRLEAEGKMTFIDHTNNGTNCFSKEEMEDFRRTPIEQFREHQKRWGR